ncbi:DUF2759 family protein [Brevibacillus fulvus]|uniref:DUF2759 domain-containing protein n=1 Tax=Brevibacillus fulvus TaxID=1125967 RepID=A0A939BSJ9_9BACL|nr:DUF2759 family protein [Brevibacillus fulvus]MBM7588604.1 hypothetical protein [Brevibacillus fulvus]
MHITLFEILMFVFTILIFAGVVRSFKAKNMFAVGYGFIALVTFVVADVLIIYYATLPKA